MTITGKFYRLLTPAERKTAMSLLGLTVIGMILETLGIGLVIPAIALLTQAESATHPMLKWLSPLIGQPTRTQLVVGGMLGLVAVYLIKGIFLAFLAWWQMKFAYGVQAHLSQRLFATYLRQPYAFHLQRNSAHLIRNLTAEVAMFTVALTDIVHLISEGLVLLGIALLLLFYQPVGTISVGLVLGAAAFGFHRGTHRRVTRWGRARQHHEGLRLQHLQQGLGGVKEVKLLGLDANILKEYWADNAECARVTQRQQTLMLIPRLWMELLAVSGLAALVITMLFQGQDLAAVVPALGLFAAAAFRLMPLFNRVLNAMQGLRFALPVVNVLHDELALGAPESAPRGASSLPFQTEIRLSSIGYTYPLAARPAIRALTLVIRRNECVGFVGASGAGKSTLVDVILGLLAPTVGEVLVDGRNIQQDLRGWQDQIGYVPQTIFLTDDTLRRNVAFGLPTEEIDTEAVMRAIRAAQLDEFVASLPEGLETKVGERGVRLSGGQRQRIGVARALYHDPSVLVLDEATSALDAATERGVMDAVVALQGSRTILIVAHRTSTIERCDRLVRLEAGCVVEETTSPGLVAPQPVV